MPSGAEQIGPSPAVHSVVVQLTVGGHPVNLRADVPVAPIPHSALLPMYRALVDKLTAVSQKTAAEAGDAVTCQRGCAACCRQPVALSVLEARELVRLVDRMPEPRRSHVKQRFVNAMRRLQAEAPHMIPRLLRPQDQPPLSAAGNVAFAREYIRLWIDCPFLEDEACSIYPDRPIACRQHQVTSPPEHCKDLSPAVRTVAPIGGAAAHWIPTSERTPTGAPRDFVALVMAPQFVAQNPGDPPPRSGKELVTEFIARMQRRGTWEKK